MKIDPPLGSMQLTPAGFRPVTVRRIGIQIVGTDSRTVKAGAGKIVNFSSFWGFILGREIENIETRSPTSVSEMGGIPAGINQCQKQTNLGRKK